MGRMFRIRLRSRNGAADSESRIKEGQKTGFYLDQRENRRRLKEVSQGKHILDVCCYTGAFSVYAGLGGAREITLIDSSQEALEMAEGHFQLNRLGRASPSIRSGGTPLR